MGMRQCQPEVATATVRSGHNLVRQKLWQAEKGQCYCEHQKEHSCDHNHPSRPEDDTQTGTKMVRGYEERTTVRKKVQESRSGEKATDVSSSQVEDITVPDKNIVCGWV